MSPTDPSARAARPRIGATHRAAVVAGVAGVLLTVAACGAGDEGGAPRSSSVAAQDAGCTDQSTAGRPGVTPLPIAPAEVTVTDQGREPRRVAAGEPARSSAQHTTLTTTSTVASADSTDEQTVTMPLTARFHCRDATDLELRLGALTSPDPTLDDQLKASRDSPGGLAIGPGSTPISLRLIPPQDSGPEARSAVEQSLVQSLQSTVPLPTQPIGVGARWRAVRTLNTAVTLTQTIDATLTRWDGHRLSLDVTIDQTPVNSVFAVPGTDQTLTIRRFSMTGSGRLDVDVTRGLPIDGSLRVAGARELVGQDPARPLIQRTGLSVTWRPTAR